MQEHGNRCVLNPCRSLSSERALSGPGLPTQYPHLLSPSKLSLGSLHSARGTDALSFPMLLKSSKLPLGPPL